MSETAVLVWCPTRPGGVVEARTRASIAAIVGAAGVVYQDENPHTHPHAVVRGIYNHLHQYQTGRERFLAGTWTHWLIVEADMIVPPDVIERLLACDADVAYAPYMLRHGRPTLNLLHAWEPRGRNPGYGVQDVTVQYRRLLQTAAGPFGRIVEVSGQGFGCVLVRRAVLEQVVFRVGRDLVHCDTYWTRDVYAAGFSMRANLDAMCGHIAGDGAVLWPDYTPAGYALRTIYDDGRRPAEFYAPQVVPSRAERLMMAGTEMVRALRSFVAWHDGTKFRVDAGDEFMLPDGADWLTAGLVERAGGAAVTVTAAAVETATGRRKRGK